MRSFIAVSVSDEVRNNVLLLQQSLSTLLEWKPVEPENLHVTIKFLGEIEETKVRSIVERIQHACSGFKKFEVTFYGLGAFPSLAAPRVLWVGIREGLETLVSLIQTIETELSKIGFPREKEHVPHLTVGRVKFLPDRNKFLAATKGLQDKSFGKTVVSSVDLMKSTLTPRGPIYTKIEEVKLEDVEEKGGGISQNA